MKADFVVALSGTPIENNLGELWSLFRAVLPGLFGSHESFRERFVVPIERNNDPTARVALRTLVQPFLLRRTKDAVARELPRRTEIRLDVPLSEVERGVYEAARREAVKHLEGLTDRGAPEARFHVLAALTRLRQLSCHVGLVDPSWAGGSAKLTRLAELLSELKESGHKVLVFSQFTTLLDRVEQGLADLPLRWLRLDGSTPDRERQHRIAAFQAGEADVFLLSLKAGGTGLNLTAADYVVHLDPWWNPAVEDQASDRAHRLGQTRPVTVYRLVSQGTVEERILALHKSKRALVSSVLEGTHTAGGLSTKQLIALVTG
jgi:SNF2 family DNA or RNA helicase